MIVQFESSISAIRTMVARDIVTAGQVGMGFWGKKHKSSLALYVCGNKLQKYGNTADWDDIL